MLNEGYQFSESGTYVQPIEGTIEDYKATIDRFPDFEKPEVFGMNDNANITFKLTESKQALATILAIQPRDTGTPAASTSEPLKTPDQQVEELCDILQAQLPPPIREKQTEGNAHKNAPTKDLKKLVAAAKSAPVAEMIDSLRVCVQQEAQRFNTLLSAVQSSIVNLRKAIKGTVVNLPIVQVKS